MIPDSHKVDYLFKKVGYGLAATENSVNKSPSNESIFSPLLIRGDTIWIQSGDIPAIAPARSNTIVQSYSGESAITASEDKTSLSNRTWLTRLTDWVGPEFGTSYQINVYAAPAGTINPRLSGIKLYPDGSGKQDSWFFDYQSGILTFPDTNLPSIISGHIIYIEGYRYVGAKGLSGVLANLSTTGATVNSLSTVAYSGSYTDLIDVPTVISSLTNDVGYSRFVSPPLALHGAIGDRISDFSVDSDYIYTCIQSFNPSNATAIIWARIALRPVLSAVATSGSYPDLTNKPSASYSFPESLVWRVDHNRNTTNLMESLYDESGARFYSAINIINSNSFEVELTQATAGTVTVFFG